MSVRLLLTRKVTRLWASPSMKDGGHDYVGVISQQSIFANCRGINKEEGANYDPRMISAKKTLEESRYPVHYLVWHNKHRQLEKELATSEQVRSKRAIKAVLFYLSDMALFQYSLPNVWFYIAVKGWWFSRQSWSVPCEEPGQY